jgi:fluoride ion exporter CrcB/FEX
MRVPAALCFLGSAGLHALDLTDEDCKLEYLIRASAVILGAVLGSAFRHTVETGNVAILRNPSSIIQLLIAAGGSFLAGFLAAQTSPLGPNYALLEQPLMSVLGGGFAVGLIGGFAILPAFTSYHAPSHPDEAEVRLIVLRVIGSLILSIVFFLSGAAFSRLVLS